MTKVDQLIYLFEVKYFYADIRYILNDKINFYDIGIYNLFYL